MTNGATGSGSGRGVRRKATTERGGKKFKDALSQLRELKSTGRRRVDAYEVVEEEDVYDEVNEDDYARLVQKRREEGTRAWISSRACEIREIQILGRFCRPTLRGRRYVTDVTDVTDFCRWWLRGGA